MKKLTMISLLTASLFIVGCGDDKPSDHLSSGDVQCVKNLRAGATSCANGGGTTTVTSTATSTVTVTQTN